MQVLMTMFGTIKSVTYRKLKGVANSVEVVLRHREGEVKIMCKFPEHTDHIRELHNEHPNDLYAFTDLSATKDKMLWLSRV
jgi:ferritin-like protein